MGTYGLVFKLNDLVWLAEYANNHLKEAFVISDADGIYETLDSKQMSFVYIKNDLLNCKVHLRDIVTFTVSNETCPGKGVKELIDEGFFEEFALSIYEEGLKSDSSINN